MADDAEKSPSVVTPFTKALIDVLTKKAVVESLGKTMVGGAVRDAIETLAEAYDFDAKEALERFEAELIEKHTDGQAGEMIMCKATTRAGTRCKRRAMFEGCCLVHNKNSKTEDEKKKRIETYRLSLTRMPFPPLASQSLE